MRKGTDDSILAWNDEPRTGSDDTSTRLETPFLAPSPSCFQGQGDVVHFLAPWSLELNQTITTPWGLLIEAPVSVTSEDERHVTMILSSRWVSDFSGPLALNLEASNI